VEHPRKIIILGATGGCVDILDAINDVNASRPAPKYECVGFLDDNPSLWGKSVLGTKVLGPFNSAGEYLPECSFVTGIGSPLNFWNKAAVISTLNLPRESFETIVHPTASVSSSAEIGVGSVIYQHVAVTTNARIGDHVLILPNTVISHDDVIGDCSIITGGVCVSGAVSIGRSCYVGTGSVIRQDITIGDCCLIGMGSVVLDDVPENSVVVGNPARFLKRVRQG
jgi:sugar O-acyltransferase (sialic acid O-acetyltransferase NeuD family)